MLLGILVLLACEEPDPELYVQMLKSRDRAERLKAANRLLRFGDAVLPRLLEEAGSEYTRVRFEVAKLLGRMRDDRAVPVLIEALDDRSANVAQAAAWSLGEIGASRAMPALLQYTNDPSKGMRQQVIRSLGACYNDSVLSEIADSVYVEVVKALRDPTPKVRISALQGIREFGYRGTSDQVIRLSRDPSDKVRHVAVQALGQIGAGVVPRSPGPATGRERDNIVEALVAALDEPLQSIRTKAVRSLEMMEERRVVAALERLRQTGTAEDSTETSRVLEKLARAPE